jgi:dGTP triphosphohydrolase
MKKRLLTEHQLRYLLREALLLLEGFKQDKEEILTLVQDDASLAEKVSKFKPPAIRWLIQRYGENAKIQETHPIADAILTLEKYISKVPQIKARWQRRDKKDYSGKSWGEILALSYEQSGKNPSWKKPPYDWENVNSWSQSPMDWGRMSSDEMSQIMTLSDLKKSKNTVAEEDPAAIFIKKVGPWNIWVPQTKSDSIRIAGFDPVTMKSNVTWCTARTSGSNLFYSYNGIDKYLIYIIKDNPRPHPDPAGTWDFISIGVKNGKIQTPAGGAGSTVERDNNVNTGRDSFFEDMKRATSPYYDQIMSVVNSIADKRRDSPSVEYQLKSLTDPKLITHVLGSLGFREKINEINSLMEMAQAKGAVISPEVRATIVKLLKIEQPDGSYNYDKFDGVHQVIRVLSQLDPNHFKSVDNLKNILEKSAQKSYIYVSKDHGLMAELLAKTMQGIMISGNLEAKQMAKKLAMLQEVKEEISSNTSVFGPEGTRFLLGVIKKARGSFQKFADLIADVKKARSVEEARLAYEKGSSVVPSKSALDDVFIAHLNSQFLPIEIIDRNVTDHRIKGEILSLPEVAKLVVQAIEEKSSALDFLRNRTRISDMLITSASPSKRSMLFSRRLIQAFDLMSSEEVFNTIQKMSRGIDELYSQDFKESVANLKTNQPEKFREVAEKVSTMVFPPKVIVDAFETEVQSVDDFLDDLLGDDLFQI